LPHLVSGLGSHGGAVPGQRQGAARAAE
jgi:hypothetical protein